MEPNWLGYITAFGSLATPIMVLIFSIIGARYKALLERKIKLDESLRENRSAIYMDILEPFMLAISTKKEYMNFQGSKKETPSERASKIMGSVEYQKRAFQLSLIGSDGVLKTYNDLMQYFYNQKPNDSENETNNEEVLSMMRKLGAFLVEIRKSLGNETTKMEEYDMLKWAIKDFYQFVDKEKL